MCTLKKKKKKKLADRNKRVENGNGRAGEGICLAPEALGCLQPGTGILECVCGVSWVCGQSSCQNRGADSRKCILSVLFAFFILFYYFNFIGV